MTHSTQLRGITADSTVDSCAAAQKSTHNIRASEMQKKISLFGIVVLLIGGAGLSNAEAAYLPAIGPSPVRFQQWSANTCAVTMLPPLKLENSILSTNVAAAIPSIDVTAEPFESFVAGLDMQLGRFAPENTSTNTAAETIIAESPVKLSAEGIITPQMLVDFFKPADGGTNALPATSSPVYFIPPLPNSSAAYRSN